jgi:crossover junction endodeoxyribonuclease RusA
MTHPATIVIPMPPSVNHVWKHGKNGSHKSANYTAWIREAGFALNQQRVGCFDGEVRVQLTLGPRDKRRDLDNCAKAPLDLLQRHGVIKNDSQITDLRISWSEKVRGCQIDIADASDVEGFTTIGQAARNAVKGMPR